MSSVSYSSAIGDNRQKHRLLLNPSSLRSTLLQQNFFTPVAEKGSTYFSTAVGERNHTFSSNEQQAVSENMFNTNWSGFERPESRVLHPRLPSNAIRRNASRPPSIPKETSRQDLVQLWIQRFNICFTLICCSIGVFWQIYSCSAEYFEYGVVSEVIVNKPRVVVPPAFTICMLYTELINLNKAFPQLGIPDHLSSTPDAIQKIQENVIADDILVASPNLTYFMESGWVRQQKSYNIIETDVSNIESIMKITMFIKDYYTCYRVMHINQTKKDFSYASKHVAFGRNPGALMGFSMDKRKLANVSRAIIYLHPSDILPRGDRDFTLNLIGRQAKVFTEAATYFSIAYSKMITQMLPEPYTTQCRDFPGMGYESEYHCQMRCTELKVIERYNKSLFTISQTVNEPNPYTTLSKYSLYKNRTLEIEIDEFDDACDRKCYGTKCKNRLYAPVIASQMDSDKYVTFKLLDPNGPQLKSIYKPRMSLPNYCVNILSIVGIWLGLSCIDIIRRGIIAFETRIARTATR